MGKLLELLRGVVDFYAYLISYYVGFSCEKSARFPMKRLSEAMGVYRLARQEDKHP